MRDRLLHLLAGFVWRRPWMILVIAAALAVASGMYAWTSLRLNANQDDLIAPNRPFMTDYRRFLQEFGDLEYIIVAVNASGDQVAAERAVDRLLAKLRAIDDLPGVHGTIEREEQLRIATRAMSDAELRELALAGGALPALRSGEFARVVGEASAMLDRLITEGASMERAAAEELAASATLSLKAVAASRSSGDSRRELSLLIDGPPREYLRSDSGRLLYINILPVKDYSTLSVIEEPIARIRGAITEVRAEMAQAGSGARVDIGLTGKPVLQYDEMATSNADMTRASAIAFLLCAMLFIVMMRGVRRPVLAVIAFGMAAAWTYGFATLTVGQLNLLSIVFMLVLVGVGLDYGVHVISRYQEFRRAGKGTREAIDGSMVTATRGNITGALTSSIVFFMAFFTTFQGLRELGLIAGGGLILCLIAMTFVLPAQLAIVERHRPARLPERPTIIGDDESANPDKVDAWFVRHSRAVLIAAIVATAALTIAPGGPRFEFNLLQLQARGLESVEWERRIVGDSSSESWFGAVIADDQPRALEIIERAKTKPTIGVIRSVFDVIRPDSPQRDAWRAKLQEVATGIGGEDADAQEQSPVVPPSLTQAAQRLRVIARAAAGSEPEQAEKLLHLADELSAIDMNDAAVRESVAATLRAIAQTLTIMLEGDRLPLREALPAAVRDQFVSPHGRYLVMLHPKADVWEYEPMRAFVADLRAVDPHVTGTPITHFESLGEMLRAFIIMSLLALAAIIVLLALDFRTVLDVILAIVPLLLGLLWTVELMGLFGVSFNLANFFAVPMLIGLGIDSAVHILHRYHEGGDRLNMGHTRRAVILTALTTIIGFGALIIAQHRGLRSLGLVMAIGSTACMLSSIIILPAMLARRATKSMGGGRRHRQQVDPGR